MVNLSRTHRFVPWLLAALVLGAFAAYVVFRQKYIGACDWFGYYELSRLFRDGRVFLPTILPPDVHPAIVPLGFHTVGGVNVPLYPPGYPVLLAIAGWFRGELFVNPVLGAVGVLLIYFTALDLTRNRWASFATALCWAFCAVVVYGATSVMSDLTATVPILGSYLLYRKGKIPWSALLLGFSIWIRPTNALYCVAFAVPLLRDRNVVRFVAWFAAAVLPFAIYNQYVYGAPWRTGYASLQRDLLAEVFPQHFQFYVVETVRHFGAISAFLLIGIPVAFRRAGFRLEAAFYILWFATHLLFYSFWKSGGDLWWWIRFLLPAYPPLFFFIAFGLDAAGRWAQEKTTRPWLQRALLLATVAVVVWTPRQQIRTGIRHRDLWLTNRGAEYRHVAAVVEQHAPAGAFVGSVEFGGTFRIYTPLIPFVSTYHDTFNVVRHAFARNTPVFLVVEPWNRTHFIVRELLEKSSPRLLVEDPVWGGVRIYQLDAAPATGPAEGP